MLHLAGISWSVRRRLLLVVSLLLSSSSLEFVTCLVHPLSSQRVVVGGSELGRRRGRYGSSSVRLEALTRPSESQMISVRINEFFRDPVPDFIKDALFFRDYELKDGSLQSKFNALELIAARPATPGVPRPLWIVILASIPTGLLWYGYYKFAVEEELLVLELREGKVPRGLGGYGTLGPFTYGMLLGPLAALLHLPGGLQWSLVGIVFIYYTQFLLYDRINELYEEEGVEEPPLTAAWCWPFFFPFNLIVGLRQIHFLSQYWYRQRGLEEPPNDIIADFFPFIKAPKFTWRQFFLTPSLWCSLLKDQKDIDPTTLPILVQYFLSLGGDDSTTRKPPPAPPEEYFLSSTRGERREQFFE